MWPLWHTCYHDGFGVSAKTVLKQPREHRISIWNKAVFPFYSTTNRKISCDPRQRNKVKPYTNVNLLTFTWNLPFKISCLPKVEMTIPSVTRDLLMLAPSFNLVPVTCVAPVLSLPARSTRCILLTVSLGASASNRACKNMRWKDHIHCQIFHILKFTSIKMKGKKKKAFLTETQEIKIGNV